MSTALQSGGTTGGLGFNPLKRPRGQDFYGVPTFPQGGTGFAISGERSISMAPGLLSANRLSQVLRPAKRARAGAAGGHESVVQYGRPPVEPVNSLGFLSNQTVPGNMTVLESSDGRYELPNVQDVVILQKSMAGRPQTFVPTASGMVVDETPRRAWTVPAFNHMLRMKQKRIPQDTTLSDVEALLVQADDEDGIQWHNPQSIMDNFYVYGVVNDSSTTSNHASQARLSSNRTRSGAESSKAGITISGREQTFPIWGPNLPPLTNLFFVLNRTSDGIDTYVTSSYHRGRPVIIDITTKEAEGLDPNPFQLQPCAYSTPQPPRSVCLYRDALGRECDAPCVAFGAVMKRSETAIEYNPRAAATNVEFVHQQGLIDIVVYK